MILRYESPELLNYPPLNKRDSDLPDVSQYGPRTCTIERYDYPELIKYGGLEVSRIKGRNMVCRSAFRTARAVKAGLRQLEKERESRVVKQKRKNRKETRRRLVMVLV